MGGVGPLVIIEGDPASDARPESAAGGGLAVLRTDDVIRVDLNTGRCDMLVDRAELDRHRTAGPPPMPPDRTPWQMICRCTVTQLADGAAIEGAGPVPQPVGHPAAAQSLAGTLVTRAGGSTPGPPGRTGQAACRRRSRGAAPGPRVFGAR